MEVLSKESVIIQLESGWFAEERWSDVPTYWMGEKSEIVVHTNRSLLIELSFGLVPHVFGDVGLSLVQGEREVVVFEPQDFSSSFIEQRIFISVIPGPNRICCTSSGKLLSPKEIGDSDDTRKLSFAFQFHDLRLLAQ